VEVAYGGWESSVLDHVGVTLEFEGELEGNGFRKGSVLEDAGTDKLSGHLGQDKIFPGLENRDVADLGFLVKLF
jgi:hypothetical protein